MPKPVLATAFATMVAFMGIGVVDPILPVIGRAMGATPAQVEMLFTSYIAVMSLAMLVAGALATRWGGRKTLLAGLGLVVVFATLSGLSNGIPTLALVRGGWGLGNALFTSTALSIIVAASAGTVSEAITLYEAALGIGIASGPLLGGVLGTISWRMPFFGTAILMAIAFVATLLSVPEPKSHEVRRGVGDVLHALRHPDVLTNALVGLGYSYGFFTVLAFSPLALDLRALPLGVTYFGWGLLVAVTSVFLVNVLRPRYGATRVLLVDMVFLIALFAGIVVVPGTIGVLVLVVVSGIFCGIANALFTTLAIEVSPFSRSISSGAYNFLRWAGAALAPVLSGLIAQVAGVRAPFAVAAAILAVATVVLALRRKRLEEALQGFARTESGGAAPDGLHPRRISAPLVHPEGSSASERG